MLLKEIRYVAFWSCDIAVVQRCYKLAPKKKNISHTLINLIENLQKYNAGKI